MGPIIISKHLDQKIQELCNRYQNPIIIILSQGEKSSMQEAPDFLFFNKSTLHLVIKKSFNFKSALNVLLLFIKFNQRNYSKK